MGATDSKLAFRKGVFRLFEQRNIPIDEDEYWSQFWLLPESADDIFSLVAASDIRRVRDQARENLETLLLKVTTHLFNLLRHSQEAIDSQRTTHMLNCIRILTRLLPFIWESEELIEWEDNFFWKSERKKEKEREEVEVIEEEMAGSATKNIKEEKGSFALGEKLVAAVLDLLFLAGFTIPASIGAASPTKINYVIWETGIGSSTPISSSKEYNLNRTETLRLLLALLSKSMYTVPHLITSKENKWIHQVVTNTERRVVLAVLCSLLNTAVKYNPLGWGVPYNYVVFPDPREILVTLCLQILLVLLDYHSPGHLHYAVEPQQQQQTASRPQHSSGSNFAHIQDKEKRRLAEYYEQLGEEAGSSSANLTIVTNIESLSPEQASSSIPDPPVASVQPVDNAFRHYLSKLHRAQDFQFLMDGIYRILSNPMLANNTYLPGSAKQVRCHPEMMMLCWKLLEINKRFRNYLLETDRVLDILVVLLYYALEYKLNTGQVGLVRMCAFILQTISSDRNFGVKINKHFDGHSSLPANVRIAAFHGSYADFLIISIYILIATTKGALSTLYPTFISTILNVSPYLKNLSVVSSNKLISLFGSFSAPGFILADEGNHRLVEYMLEIFNNVVQYQYSSNPNLIYAIVRAHKKFEDMKSFNLAAALAEIERVRTLKQDKQNLIDQQRTDSTAPAEDASISTRDAEGHNQDNKAVHKTEYELDIVLKGSLAASGVQDENGVMSEKARGKMPIDEVIAESSSSITRSGHNRVEPINSPRTSTSSHRRGSTTAPSVGQVAVGRNRFVPTEDWVSIWFTDLPISTIVTLINYLLPLVQKLCEQQSLTTDSQVLEYVRTVTLEEMLLPTSPVHVRKFQWGEALVIWFRSLLWGQVYIYSLTQATNMFAGTAVKLFSIKQAPVQNNVALTAASVVDRVGDRFGATVTNIVQDVGNRVRAAGTVGLGGSSSS